MAGVKVYGLGGLGESGKNMYVVEIDEDIFVIDAGISVPKNNQYSVELIIPDIKYLVDNKHRIQGIFLTSGCLERIGAITFIMDTLDIPIYGSDMTISLVQKQLGTTSDRLLHPIDAQTELYIGKNKISFLQMAYSIPGTYGICIHSIYGNIVHLGNVKIDLHHREIDIGKWSSIKEEGVLFLLSDCMNVDKLGYSPSEQIVGRELFEIFKKSRERIFVEVSSTNIYKIQQIFEKAAITSRMVTTIDSEIIQTIEIARKLGYLYIPEDTFMMVEDTDKYSKNSLIILTSEYQEAGTINGSNKCVKVEREDICIVSSSAIPGNELIVSNNINSLLRLGATVIELGVHSSDGYQEELKTMIAILSPKFIIPVHGEYRLQKEYQKLAVDMNIPNQHVFVLANGEVVNYVDNGIILGERIHSGEVYIDDKLYSPVDSVVLRDRKKLSENGAFIIVLVVDKRTRKLLKKPTIESKGFIGYSVPEELRTIIYELTGHIVSQYSRDFVTLKNKLREALQQLFYEQLKRRPLIIPTIMECADI